MAVTSIWSIKGWIGKVINYAENPDKTKENNEGQIAEDQSRSTQGLNDVITYAVNAEKIRRRQSESMEMELVGEAEELMEQYVSGVNCAPTTAREEMIAVKKRFGKEDGIVAFHGYQSFAPGECNPAMAHEIGKKLAEELWGSQYQVLIATHLDKANHLHKPNSKAEDCAPKMLTKQEIKTKTPAGVRELPIPDYVFEAILEERKTYEKNRRRRPKEFRDWNYICCSTYGNPRSKGFHQKYYKDLLKSLDLPDIHFHQLRNTYATILLKNSFNSKGVSHLLGHAKEIISVDVYGDTQEIIEDCLDVLEPFIEEVIPKERKDQYYDYSEVIEIDLILEEYFHAA